MEKWPKKNQGFTGGGPGFTGSKIEKNSTIVIIFKKY